MAPVKPKNLDPKVFKKALDKSVKIDPKAATYIEFLYVHQIDYPKLNVNSKDAKIMYKRVNDIRQMTAGVKKFAKAINDAIKDNPKDKDAQVTLLAYLELLRAAERDRQNWIKIERGVGNTKNLDELIMGPGLDDVIRI